MKTKLKSVLLVDDDRAVNFLHKRIIEKMGGAQDVHVAEDGQQAIDFLNTSIKDGILLPDLIILDLNMPIMDGWEFIEEYRNMNFDKKKEIVLLMMTSSLNNDDKVKALLTPEVNGFQTKSLKPVLFKEELEKYFEI